MTTWLLLRAYPFTQPSEHIKFSSIHNMVMTQIDCCWKQCHGILIGADSINVTDYLSNDRIKLWTNGLLLYPFCIHILPWVLVAVRHIAADSGLRHVAHNTHSPVNLDLLRADLDKLHSAHSVSESFSHLFHCAVTADIKKVWLQILAARISSDKEQGASKVRRAFTAVSVEF